jgi:hypothetical protein
VGERAEPQCTAGDGKKNAFAIEAVAEGANYKFGTWPPSGIKAVTVVPESTLDDEALELDDDEQAKLAAASGKSGELSAHQVAEIDLDGNDNKEKVFSVYIPHPQVIEQYTWSGIFLAPDGDLGKLVLLETSKTKKDVFEVKGTLDLDGDGKRELWMRIADAEGAGDRILRFAGGKPDPIGRWSCGM